MFMVFKKMWI